MFIYISQLAGGLALMLLGSIIAGVASAVNKWWRLFCVLIALPLCTMGIFLAVIAPRAIFGL